MSGFSDRKPNPSIPGLPGQPPHPPNAPEDVPPHLAGAAATDPNLAAQLSAARTGSGQPLGLSGPQQRQPQGPPFFGRDDIRPDMGGNFGFVSGGGAGGPGGIAGGSWAGPHSFPGVGGAVSGPHGVGGPGLAVPPGARYDVIVPDVGPDVGGLRLGYPRGAQVPLHRGEPDNDLTPTPSALAPAEVVAEGQRADLRAANALMYGAQSVGSGLDVAPGRPGHAAPQVSAAPGIVPDVGPDVGGYCVGGVCYRRGTKPPQEPQTSAAPPQTSAAPPQTSAAPSAGKFDYGW